jgi:hypothetical protein
MLARIRLAWLIRNMRKDLGVPMKNWWICLGLPYIWTGKTPKLGPEWKIWDGE